MDIKNLEKVRHSLAHILAMAVQELHPKAKLGMGPAIENGFYYDFALPAKASGEGGIGTFVQDDLPKIEAKMREIIEQDIVFKKSLVSKEEAEKLFKNQPYKKELIKELKEKKATIYKSGDFVDLCKGPHIKTTLQLYSGQALQLYSGQAKETPIDGFKLTKIAGAYWRGDEKNKMLSRIYGVAFENKKDLGDYLKRQIEAEKRDHRALGEKLDLFSFHSEAPGSVFWHPKGMIIWNELEKFGKSLRKKYESQEIQTPQLAKKILWEKSGHWDHYKDSMFYFDVEKETYCLKPMDCPFNIKIYQTKIRSYKELPIRYTEIGRVLRNEKSGELFGLFRVRSVTQDDAHIFVAEEQIEKEISLLLGMVKEYYKAFGIKPEFFLSTRPEDFIGEIPTWNKAEANLKSALKKEKIVYGIKEKDGAFYGPKIDINIKDALGRSWQLATILLDFQLAKRSNAEYIDKSGKKKNPVMIHAAIFGSFERFIGILLEHYAGALPFWLSPVQVIILPISDKHIDYSEKIKEKLSNKDFRVELKGENETLSKKILEAETQKIPYIVVVGDREIKENKVSLRERGKGNIGSVFLDKLIEILEEKRENKGK
ncbi:MAG: threonine--tRNA ligase [bacterium]|nr:threonine--tRNA ligase [bacterium]